MNSSSNNTSQSGSSTTRFEIQNGATLNYNTTVNHYHTHHHHHHHNHTHVYNHNGSSRVGDKRDREFEVEMGAEDLEKDTQDVSDTEVEDTEFNTPAPTPATPAPETQATPAAPIAPARRAPTPVVRSSRTLSNVNINSILRVFNTLKDHIKPLNKSKSYAGNCKVISSESGAKAGGTIVVDDVKVKVDFVLYIGYNPDSYGELSNGGKYHSVVRRCRDLACVEREHLRFEQYQVVDRKSCHEKYFKSNVTKKYCKEHQDDPCINRIYIDAKTKEKQDVSELINEETSRAKRHLNRVKRSKTSPSH